MPARAVLVGSRHTAESLWAAMPLEGLRERTFLGPPGVDVHTFAPARARGGAGRPATRSCAGSTPRSATGFGAAGGRGDRRALRSAPRRAARRGEELAAGAGGLRPGRHRRRARRTRWPRSTPPRDPVVCFVGKLIVSKGIDLLLAAWPLVLAREPRREAGRGRLRHLPGGPRGPAARARARGRAAADARLPAGPRARGRPARPAHLPAHLPRGPRGPPRALLRGGQEDARAASSSPAASTTASWPGCCRATEAVVVPSMFPEAFGMVAAEAAACGALPICAGALGPCRGGGDPGREAAAPGPRAADLRARHAGGRGARAVDQRLAGARRPAARLRAGRAGAHRGRPVRLGGGRRRACSRRHGAAPRCWSRSPARCRSAGAAESRARCPFDAARGCY